jgi:two-component system, cell cycle response regulator DivK
MVKILLIEDNATIRDMLMRRLQRRNFDVTTAGDGQAACALAVAERPDLILMDMHLPILDGWEATRQLKRSEATRTIPIIALTADAMSGDRAKALEAGCDDYETKPIDLPSLLGKIDRLVPAKPPSGQSATP